MKKGHYRPAVFILTYRKEKGKILYLLLKRKLHWKGWEFPKGGIEKGERLIQAVKRELLEETRQKTRKIVRFNLSGKYKYNKSYPDRKGIIGQSWHLFTCQISGKKVKLDKKEHSEYKWLPFSDASKLLTWPNQKSCLYFVHHALEK